MEITSLDGPSRFAEVLGGTPWAKVIDALLGEVGMDFTLKEIARKSEVGYATVKRMWPSLLKTGLIKPTRKIAKATFYTYDRKNPVGRALYSAYWDMLYTDAKKEIESQELEPIHAKK